MTMEITEVLTRYGTQEKCIEYLEEQKWRGVPKCPYCGSERSTRRKDGLRIKCHVCNKSYTVLVGSIMESTKLPLVKWFAAMCLMLHAKKGISSLQLSRDIGVNKNTAWYLQKRIRQAMNEDDIILKGLIEADESYIGGSLVNKHYYKKQRLNYDKSGMEHKTPVLGMIQRQGKILAKVLSKAWGEEIKPILKEKIDRSSELVTDGFGGYKDLDQHFKAHVRLNHSKHIRKIGEYHTNTIEGFWSMLKRAIIGQYHKVSPQHLQSYLDEITFKYNHRNEKNNFNLLISRSLNIKCATC